MSLSGCFYFVRYWAIFVLQLLVNQLWRVNFEINFIFLIKTFFLHFSSFLTAIEAIKTILEGENPILTSFIVFTKKELYDLVNLK